MYQTWYKQFKLIESNLQLNLFYSYKTLVPTEYPVSFLFVGYYNTTKVIVYFDPNTRRIKRTFHCCIDEYDIKLHPEKSMSLGSIILHTYSSGVYQPGTPSPDPKICMIWSSLDISYPPFSSSELMKLELLIPPKWDAYEHNYFRLSDLLCYLHLPSAFKFPHWWPNPFGHPPKHLRGIHRKSGSFTCRNCFPDAPGQMNALDTPLQYSPLSGNIHMHSHPLSNT